MKVELVLIFSSTKYRLHFFLLFLGQTLALSNPKIFDVG